MKIFYYFNNLTISTMHISCLLIQMGITFAMNFIQHFNCC